MKEGLTYISERTGQLRYADHSTQEQWIQQLPTFIPLGEIKRGQPVSVATKEDIIEYENEIGVVDNELLKTTERFCVLTNPLRHTSCIGLSLEYTNKAISYNMIEKKFEFPNKIHIINQGFYEENKSYISNSQQNNEGESKIENTEYWPEFFNAYPNNIGKKVYVKAINPSDENPIFGELTTSQSEVYLPENNVIVIGFVSDTVGAVPYDNSKAGIQVQLMGDDRNVVNTTQFTIELGEDVNLKNSYGGIKIFALGSGSKNDFKLRFLYEKDTSEKALQEGFICFERSDGNSIFITTNNGLTSQNLNSFDQKCIERAKKYLGSETLSTIKQTFLTKDEIDPEKLLSNINGAFKGLHIFQESDSLVNETVPPLEVKFTSTEVAETVNLYISSTWKKYFKDLEYINDVKNNGKAILADIRDSKRQNIIGACLTHQDFLKKGSNIILLKQGMIPLKSGKTVKKNKKMYLNYSGDVIDTPQEEYNSVAEVGYFVDYKEAAYGSAFFSNCLDIRKYNYGDLPVGYIKPSVEGKAENGFYLMDGSEHELTENNTSLYKRLNLWYGVESAPKSGEKKYFTIPKVIFSSESSTGEYPAQIKWLVEGVYKDLNLSNFVPYRKISGKIIKGKINEIDITDLIISTPRDSEDSQSIMESLDIKLYADISPLVEESVDNWQLINSGFNSYNNFIYYGFNWKIEYTAREEGENPPHPFGKWILRADYSGNKKYDQSLDNSLLGIASQVDPFAPPVQLDNVNYRLYIAKKDFYVSREINIDSLVKNPLSDDQLKQVINNIIHGGITTSGSIEAGSVNANSANLETLTSGTIKANSLTISILPEVTSDIGVGITEKNLITKGLSDASIQQSKDEITKNFYTILENGEFTKNSDSQKTKVNSLSYKGIDKIFKYNDNKKDNAYLSFVEKQNHNYKNHLGNYFDIYSSSGEGKDLFLNETYLTRKPEQANSSFYEYTLSKDFDNSSVIYEEDKKISTQSSVFSNKTFQTVGVRKYIEDKSDVSDFFFYTKKENSTPTGAIVEAGEFKGNRIQAQSYSNNSSIIYKYLLQKFWSTEETAQEILESGKDKSSELQYQLFGDNALQALGELPLASFKYDRNMPSGESDATKQYLGVIVEQVHKERDSFNQSTLNEYSIFDDNYTYTEDESKSIYNYLNIVTDDSEKAMNVSSTVGLLLKGAQEAQGRLLKLERSTFGKDLNEDKALLSNKGLNETSKNISNSLLLSSPSQEEFNSIFIEKNDDGSVSFNGNTTFGDTEKDSVLSSFNEFTDDYKTKGYKITPIAFQAYYNSINTSKRLDDFFGDPLSKDLSGLYKYSNKVLSEFKTIEDCNYISTENIENLVGPQEIDGVLASIGETVLLVGQTNKSENGLYKIKTDNWEGLIKEEIPAIDSPRKIYRAIKGTNNKNKVYFLANKKFEALKEKDFEELNSYIITSIKRGKGLNSVAQELCTDTGDNSFTVGKYNDDSKLTKDSRLFTVGVGSSDSDKKNAIEVRDDGYLYINDLRNTSSSMVKIEFTTYEDIKGFIRDPNSIDDWDKKVIN